MSGLNSLGTVLCSVCVGVAVLSSLIPQKRTRRVMGVVIGLFLLSAICGSVRSVWESVEWRLPASGMQEPPSYSGKDLDRAVAQRTADNLTRVLDELLQNEGIAAKDIALTLKISDNGGIYASRIVIYIGEEDVGRESEIERIVYGNLSKEPEIYVAGKELQGFAQQ